MEEAFEEGQCPHRAVEAVMMMNKILSLMFLSFEFGS
jgi:hypothetical protein